MSRQLKPNLPSCVPRAGSEEGHMIGAAVGPGCSHAPIPIDGAMTHDFIRDFGPGHAQHGQIMGRRMDTGEPNPKAMDHRCSPRCIAPPPCRRAMATHACATRDPVSGPLATGRRPLFVTSHGLLTSPAPCRGASEDAVVRPPAPGCGPPFSGGRVTCGACAVTAPC